MTEQPEQPQLDDRTLSALKWLGYACGDLTSAVRYQNGVPDRITAFHAQQAAEKAIKAALILSGIAFKYDRAMETHAGQLPAGWGTGASLDDLARLAAMHTTARYPTPGEEITKKQAQWALAKARVVYRSIYAGFQGRGVPMDQLLCR